MSSLAAESKNPTPFESYNDKLTATIEALKAEGSMLVVGLKLDESEDDEEDKAWQSKITKE